MSKLYTDKEIKLLEDSFVDEIAEFFLWVLENSDILEEVS